MSGRLGKTEIQLAIFEEILERLVKGEGKYVAAGTKLSMAQLAKESGVGSGTIYYKPYSDFRIRAMERMAQYNSRLSLNHVVVISNRAELQALRHDRNNEKRLKNEYRESRDELRAQVKRLCAERGAVEHALYEAILRIEELEVMFENVTGKRPDDCCFERLERDGLFHGNLQLIKKKL